MPDRVRHDKLESDPDFPSLTDSGFSGCSHLAELVAVLLVLLHLVVRDSLAGHAAYLRLVFEGPTVAPPPGPAR